MSRMGLPVAPLLTVLYRMTHTTDARMIAEEAENLNQQGIIALMKTIIPARTVFNESSTLQTPVHRLERRRRTNARSPCAREIMETFARELFDRAADLTPASLPIRAPVEARTVRHGGE